MTGETVAQEPTPSYPFSNELALYYNVGVWGDRGYGVPFFGRTTSTVNETLEEFISEGGKRLSIIMHSEDANRGDVPSLNTIVRMVLLLNRSRVMLIGSAIPENQQKFESLKVGSQRRPLKVYPCPYFKVQNRLCRKFADAAFAMLSELLQSSEISISYDITDRLAAQATRDVARFQKMLAMQYFGLDVVSASAPTLDLMLMLDKYTPTKYGHVSSEILDTPGTLSLPSEWDLGPLAQGILIAELPKLGPYPWPDTMPTVEGRGDPNSQLTQGGSSAAGASGAATGQALPPLPSNTTFVL